MTGRLIAMDETHIEAAAAIMGAGLGEAAGRRAKATLQAHFRARSLGLDDGRTYYVWLHEGQAVGLTGLHHYNWGPKDNVWLAFFGVHPAYQRRGIGSQMIQKMEALARKKYKKFFIETNSDNTNAHRFYKKNGFYESGIIRNYKEDGSEILVFIKKIEKINRG